MIVGHYILRNKMKNKRYRISLSADKHKEGYKFPSLVFPHSYRVKSENIKVFKLKIEFNNVEMKNEFLRYFGYYRLIEKNDKNKNYIATYEREVIEKCIHQLESFLWSKYLTIIALNKNKIGGIFMLEELK